MEVVLDGLPLYAGRQLALRWSELSMLLDELEQERQTRTEWLAVDVVWARCQADMWEARGLRKLLVS